jgi:hypothetical protein
MKVLKAIFTGLFPIVLAVIGVLAIVFGEIDDSPGLMLIGLILILVASYINIKQKFR